MQMFVHKGMNESWYIHTMEYCTAVQRDDPELHTAPQKTLTDQVKEARHQRMLAE